MCFSPRHGAPSRCAPAQATAAARLAAPESLQSTLLVLAITDDATLKEEAEHALGWVMRGVEGAGVAISLHSECTDVSLFAPMSHQHVFDVDIFWCVLD